MSASKVRFLDKMRLSDGVVFSSVQCSSADYDAAGRFVSLAYKTRYNADIYPSMPVLFTLSDTQQLQAVVGVRSGDVKPFFLESYLQSPIEQYVAQAIKQPVFRSQIAEVGALAALGQCCSLQLFVAMAATMRASGCQWLVFTATPEVQKLLRRLGLSPQWLADADPQLVPQSERWGSYYHSLPVVMMLDLAASLEIVARDTLYASYLLGLESDIQLAADSIGR